MSSRPRTPSHEVYGSNAAATDPDTGGFAHGYGTSAVDHANHDTSSSTAAAVDLSQTPGNPIETSPLGQSMQQQPTRLGRFEEDFDAVRPQSSAYGGSGLHRSASSASVGPQGTPSRSGTLKKRASVSRRGSLKRSGSRKSLRAGSIKGVTLHSDSVASDSYNSAFFTPIPTSGSPTDILANRFQAWRRLIKDLLTYFREVQTSYEARSKALLKVSNVINNTNAPSLLLFEGGINDANRILRDYHKQAVTEANKAREIESEVIAQLGGLRGDLGQKIKEIKSLSGDFKNSVEKEKEGTRKAVSALEDALAAVDTEPESAVGKGDPYVVRLGVERQLEKQIDEENYLHRAYLNLEGSGRELESIVVGEIQKAYNALASILKRDADEAYNTIEKLRSGPIAIPKDLEWGHFVESDSHIVGPDLPLRRVLDIDYPGKHHPAAAEVRAGMLERKSKYLKSYTPGWYVLSPTHLHEFKSADRIYTQPPVMSLFLKDQKLGSHSQPNSSSHKFILKGRQTGGMHRGHSWVFRAESFDTMMAWYEEIRSLTEKSGEERNAYVRRHARSLSNSSQNAPSIASSAELDEDEADAVPYSGVHANQNSHGPTSVTTEKERPSPGGRFPSDLQVERHLHAPFAPSSGSSEDHFLGGANDRSAGGNAQYHDGPPTAAAEAYDDYEYAGHRQVEPTGGYGEMGDPQAPLALNTAANDYQPYGEQYAKTDENYVPSPEAQASTPQKYSTAPQTGIPAPSITSRPPKSVLTNAALTSHPQQPERHNSLYGDWMAPVSTAASGTADSAEAYRQNQQQQQQQQQQETADPAPSDEPANPYSEQNQATAIVPVAATSYTSEPDTTSPPPATNEPEPSQTVPVGIGPMRAESVAIGKESDAPATTIAAVDGGVPMSPASTLSGETDIGERTPFGAAATRPGQMLRQDTDTAIAKLHVPGSYPRGSVAGPSSVPSEQQHQEENVGAGKV